MFTTPTPGTCERNERLTVLYEQYRLPIYCFIKSRIQSAEVAEDLTASVFEKMITKYDFDRCHAAKWLYRVARNLMIDLFRHEKALPIISLDGFMQENEQETFSWDVPDTSLPFDEYVAADDWKEQIISHLPTEKEREAMRLRCETTSAQFIAAYLGISVTAAKMRVMRAKILTREIVEAVS